MSAIVVGQKRNIDIIQTRIREFMKDLKDSDIIRQFQIVNKDKEEAMRQLHSLLSELNKKIESRSTLVPENY